MDNITITPKERKLFFSSQVTQESIKKLSESIIKINEHDEYLKKYSELHDIVYNPRPIEIYIDSYGGAVYQILGLIGIIEHSKTPVHTICTGAAMSCGFMLLIYGHKRFSYKHGTPLYHQISTGFVGKVQDMEENFAQVKKLQDKFEEMTMEKTKITKKKLDKIRKKKVDWFMTADEALELGVVDEVI